MDLKKLNLVELNAQEKKETVGGFGILEIVVGLLVTAAYEIGKADAQRK